MKTKLLTALLSYAVHTTQGFVISSPLLVSPKTELFFNYPQQGKPAASKEQDLELTRNVILKHIGQVEDTIVNGFERKESTAVEQGTTSTSSPFSSTSTSNKETTSLRKRDRLARAIQKLKPFQK
jgi:hypothetical protein